MKFIDMKNVALIIERKGNKVVSIQKGATVIDALKIMAEKNIGSIIVKDQDAYMGLLTERDYARKVILKGKSSSDIHVEEIMSTDLPAVTLETTIENCMHMMSSNNLRYLPVFCDGDLCGIISINDLIREIISGQKETINQLESYIHS